MNRAVLGRLLACGRFSQKASGEESGNFDARNEPRVAAPPPRVTVLLDKTYEPGAALPSIQRGRRVDLKIDVAVHKIRSSARCAPTRRRCGRLSSTSFSNAAKFTEKGTITLEVQ